MPIHLYGQPIARDNALTFGKEQARGFLQACRLRTTDDNKAIRAGQIDQLRTDDNFLIAFDSVLAIELYAMIT